MRYNLALHTDESRVPDMGSFTKDTITWIYDVLSNSSRDYVREIHDIGIKVGAKVIKPFVFSMMYRKAGKGDWEFKVSSPDPRFNHHFKHGLDRTNTIVVTGIRFRITGREVSEFEVGERYFTLSPLLIKNVDGFTSPFDTEALRKAVTSNLRLKYSALYGKEADGEITELSFQQLGSGTLTYKKHPFRGIVGQFVMKGSTELLKIAYDLGIGAKNAAGFGFIETAA